MGWAAWVRQGTRAHRIGPSSAACTDPEPDLDSGNDLYALVLFARIDEYQRDLHEANFVWTAVLVTDGCLRALDRGTRSGKLGWSEVFSWWEDGHGLAARSPSTGLVAASGQIDVGEIANPACTRCEWGTGWAGAGGREAHELSRAGATQST
jgi:hypothetical protein